MSFTSLRDLFENEPLVMKLESQSWPSDPGWRDGRGRATPTGRTNFCHANTLAKFDSPTMDKSRHIESMHKTERANL